MTRRPRQFVATFLDAYLPWGAPRRTFVLTFLPLSAVPMYPNRVKRQSYWTCAFVCSNRQAKHWPKGKAWTVPYQCWSARSWYDGGCRAETWGSSLGSDWGRRLGAQAFSSLKTVPDLPVRYPAVRSRPIFFCGGGNPGHQSRNQPSRFGVNARVAHDLWWTLAPEDQRRWTQTPNLLGM